MFKSVFEITKTDLGGRVGILHTNHGTVHTPAFVPVVHPVQQSVPASVLSEMGFEMVITNAYITMKRYGDEAIQRGIHGIIDFEGPVMTDSGGYQVLEYGDIGITASQMAKYEEDIMTDIAIPLDKPTGLGLPFETATSYVRHTLRVSGSTLRSAANNGQIWAGPIQGSEYGDLVRRSARTLLNQGYAMMALGSPVEFMESYRYSSLASMICEARSALSPHVPLHLFGAGHPLTIPLAISLGCDTFDSASYILYAKQDRYITPDGTRHLSEMRKFTCVCPICISHTPAELAADSAEGRRDALAIHNLYAIKLEVDSTTQAIHEGRLWEYVSKKSRAHPRLYEAMSILYNNASLLQPTTPIFKERAIFLLDDADQFRPEILHLRHTLKSFRTKKRILHILPMPSTKPAYMSGTCQRLAADPDVQVCVYQPHLGIIPLELSDMYPAAHHMAARVHRNPLDYTEFAESCRALLLGNRFDEVRHNTNDSFLQGFVALLKNKKKETL